MDFRLLVGYGSSSHTVSSLPLSSPPLETEHYSRIQVAASTSPRAPLHSHKSQFPLRALNPLVSRSRGIFEVVAIHAGVKVSYWCGPHRIHHDAARALVTVSAAHFALEAVLVLHPSAPHSHHFVILSMIQIQRM